MLSKLDMPVVRWLIFTVFLTGCLGIQNTTNNLDFKRTPSSLLRPVTPVAQRSAESIDLSRYAFPESVNPSKQYLFFLHGKIVEDQGIPAISPDYGEYEYRAILEALESNGFMVISERRAKNTDSAKYAKRIAGQVNSLLGSGVPANNISIVGASKGAGITVYISNLLMNSSIHYVLLASCDPSSMQEWMENQISISGKVLSIYDYKDEYAGSCRELFLFSEGKGISSSNEIVLHNGMGHGIVYKPLDEWIMPTVQWAGR